MAQNELEQHRLGGHVTSSGSCSCKDLAAEGSLAHSRLDSRALPNHRTRGGESGVRLGGGHIQVHILRSMGLGFILCSTRSHWCILG